MKKNTIGYIAILALLAAASAVSLGLFFREGKEVDRADIRKFPMVVGDWKGKDTGITEREYDILETRNLVSREYTNSKNESIYLFIIYSETNRRVFHPPEVCMVGSDIDIVDKQAQEISGDKKSFLMNKLYTEKDAYKGLVLYGYKAGDLYTNNYYFQQAYLALHQIFGRRVPGATVRVSMSMAKGEEAALDTLKDFLAQVVKIVDSISSGK